MSGKTVKFCYLRTEGSSPFGMTVQLGYNHRGNVDLLFEGSGLRLTSLTYGTWMIIESTLLGVRARVGKTAVKGNVAV